MPLWQRQEIQEVLRGLVRPGHTTMDSPPPEVICEVAEGAKLCEATGHGGGEGRVCSARSVGETSPGFGFALWDAQNA